MTDDLLDIFHSNYLENDRLEQDKDSIDYNLLTNRNAVLSINSYRKLKNLNAKQKKKYFLKNYSKEK